ncbi:hypothetical protein ACFVHQ_22230 [Actinomycetes bacterium NPDC127524]
MFEYGKILLRNNVTQLFFLFFCFGLVILAKNFSIGITGLSLHDFVSSSLKHLISDSESYGLVVNVVMPFMFYLVASTLLLWMGYFNLTTFQYEDSRINMVLKLLLGSCQGILSIWFLMLGSKLAFYFLAFVVTIGVFFGILIFLFKARTEHD